MLDTLKMKLIQKKQYIPDIKNAKINSNFRGLPILDNSKCQNCKLCEKNCPLGAITTNPLKIDLAKCTLCGQCQKTCVSKAIDFSSFYKLAVDSVEKLIITEKTTKEFFYSNAIEVRKEINKIFGKSLKLRQVSAGGCNGCEMELNACSNANFDMGRFGIEFVASPRHADGIVLTGPITKNMAFALEDCYNSIPEPKIIILCGTCAMSGGIFADSPEINREFLEKHKIDLFIPGCPVHPLTFINGIIDFIRKN